MLVGRHVAKTLVFLLLVSCFLHTHQCLPIYFTLSLIILVTLKLCTCSFVFGTKYYSFPENSFEKVLRNFIVPNVLREDSKIQYCLRSILVKSTWVNFRSQFLKQDHSFVLIINGKKISCSSISVNFLVITINSQIKFKKHMKVTARKYFLLVSIESENKMFLTAEKIRILAITTTFIYSHGNIVLLICRFDIKRKENAEKESLFLFCFF